MPDVKAQNRPACYVVESEGFSWEIKGWSACQRAHVCGSGAANQAPFRRASKPKPGLLRLWIFQLGQPRLHILKLGREPDHFVFNTVTPADERREQFIIERQFTVY